MIAAASGKLPDGRKRLERSLGVLNASLAENRPSLHWVTSPSSKQAVSPQFKSHKVNSMADRSSTGVLELARKQFIENKRYLAEGGVPALPSSPNNFFLLSQQSKLKGVGKQNAKIKSQMLLKIDLSTVASQQNSTSSIIFDAARHTKRLVEKAKHKTKLAALVGAWPRGTECRPGILSPDRLVDSSGLDILKAHHRNFCDYRFTNAKEVKIGGGGTFQNQIVMRFPKGESSFSWGSQPVERKPPDIQVLTVRFLEKFAKESRADGGLRRRRGSYCRMLPKMKPRPSIRESSAVLPIKPRIWMWMIEKLLKEKNLKKVG